MKVYNSVRQLITLGVLSIFLAFGSQAQATSYSSLVVFGDSLSDSGNVEDAFGLLGFGPGPAYADSRFTSDFTDGTPGLVWVEHLASLMGVALDNSVAGGTNYAFGGATAVDAGFVPSLPSQVSFYLSDLASSGVGLDATGLFVVWGGGNDVLSASLGAGAATSIGATITDLYLAGARNFLIPNLPDIGFTPEGIAGGAGLMALLSGATLAHNAALAVELAALSVLTDINIIGFDVFGLFGDILSDPGAFGLSNVSDACAGLVATVGVCTDPDSFLFFDNIHPTAISHEMMGLLAFSEIKAIPVPAALPLMLSALGFLGWRARRA